MLNLIERLVFRYEFARSLREHIEGLTWRKAFTYADGPIPQDGDPIEAAQDTLAKMRRRY